MMAVPRLYSGPVDHTGTELHPLGEGIWVTSSRSVVIEADSFLILVDPGDEPMQAGGRPSGALADLFTLVKRTGKPLGEVWITHAHPDHVANLPLLRALGDEDPRIGAFRLLAHQMSPVHPDQRIDCSGELLGEITVLPTPGHSHWNDDLSFFHASSGVLLSGDLIQPKGEQWETTFYPSPFPFFTDGDLYLSSLATLEALPFTTLVTGHREVRGAPAGRHWVELTRRAIEAVRDGVRGWSGADNLAVAAPALYQALAAERGIDEATIAKRMTQDASGYSAFDRFDLPGFAYFWQQRAGAQ